MPAGDHAALDWLRVPTCWAADYAELPALAWGIHVRLMMVSARRGPLPADHDALARLAGCTRRELSRCWLALSEHWTVAADRMTCPHVEDERQRMVAARAASRAGGRIGAARRWGGDRDTHAEAIGDPIGDPIGSLSVVQSKSKSKSPESDPDVEPEPVRTSPRERGWAAPPATDRRGSRLAHDGLAAVGAETGQGARRA